MVVQGVTQANADSLCYQDWNQVEILPKANYQTTIECRKKGTIVGIDAKSVGM